MTEMTDQLVLEASTLWNVSARSCVANKERDSNNEEPTTAVDWRGALRQSLGLGHISPVRPHGRSGNHRWLQDGCFCRCANAIRALPGLAQVAQLRALAGGTDGVADHLWHRPRSARARFG